MKKFLVLFFTSIVVFVAVFALTSFSIKTVSADGFSGTGTGVENDPYVITSCAQLQEMNLDVVAYYKLDATEGVIDCSMTNPEDLDFNGAGIWADEKGFEPIGDTTTTFAGHLDGNNNTIDGLFINRADENFVGLFSTIDSGSTVSDVGLTNVNITGNQRTGALAGSLSGTVTNAYSTGTVNGSYSTGGLVGSHVDNNSWYNSSPLIYTWNGSKYKYVADVGNLLPKEITNSVDLASIDKADLVPKGDTYSMKISEEYNEIVYFDELSMMTYDHAPGYTVAVPLNRTASTSDIRTVSDTPTNPLVSCTDMYGRDCLNDLGSYDDKWSYKDKSGVNYWVMDFGDLSNATTSVQLLMRGARDYALSAKMKAAGTYSQLRTVEVKNAQGDWVQIYNKNDLGSDGTPRLRTIDLTGKFLTNDYRVKVGFDTFAVNYFAVDTTAQVPVTINTYYPSKADLSFRGFTEIDKTYYANHNYDKVNPLPVGMFKPQFGNFTKYGDVSPLLQSTNNQFVIMKGGDHMDIEFPYVPPAEGMVRDVVMYNNAVYKHASNDGMDLLGKTVNPLPYIGMTDYTSATNGYPMTVENQNYLNTWNTRVYTGTPRPDRLSGSTIINSYSTANVYGTSHVGGLVGYNEKEIRASYATGNVEALYSVAGGLVGENQDGGSMGWIHDSYALGNVTAGGNVGGLVGNNYWGTIERSYATGLITTNGGHGLIGWGSGGTVNDSFWDTETTNMDNGGSGTGKTTAEMTNIETFTDTGTPGLSNAWDFTGTENNDEGTDDVWKIDTYNDGYPYLSWQLSVPGPTISDVVATTATTSATITWNTNATTSSSRVLYSISDSHYIRTSEYNTSPRVNAHSVVVPDLLPCTTYFFKVYSAGAYSNRTTSTSSSFTTSGCSAGTSPSEKITARVDTTAVATTTLNIAEGSKYFRVVTPEDLASTTNSVVIQIKSLDKTAVLGSVGTPSNLSGVGSIVFDVKALINGTTTLDSFDVPVTITYKYSDADVVGFNESSLVLYHYHSGTWSMLNSCMIDTEANAITCTAPHFSIFSLFGTPSASVATVATGRTGGGGTSFGCTDPKASNYQNFVASKPSMCTYGVMNTASVSTSTSKTPSTFKFTRTLRRGMVGDDVKELQKILNANGFSIALTGPGSKGSETTRFGIATQSALIKFQKANKITPAIGMFGPVTRGVLK